MRIDGGGQPFRASGVRGRPVYDYDAGSRHWVSADAADDGVAESSGDRSPEGG